jgi:hypothetical protein
MIVVVIDSGCLHERGVMMGRIGKGARKLEKNVMCKVEMSWSKNLGMGVLDRCLVDCCCRGKKNGCPVGEEMGYRM